MISGEHVPRRRKIPDIDIDINFSMFVKFRRARDVIRNILGKDVTFAILNINTELQVKIQILLLFAKVPQNC